MDGPCTTLSTPPARLAVLISGNGTNLQAVIDACRTEDLAAEVVVVVSNVDTAYGLKRAATAGIDTVVVERLPGEQRSVYDSRLAAVVRDHSPDVVVLAGWMRILTNEFLDQFPNRVVNLHPALPGELPGTRAIERAWQEALAGERTHSGVMVHLVPDEGVDDGPVLISESVEVRLDDTLDTFTERMHAVEHRLLVDALRQLCDGMVAAHPSSPHPPRTPAEQQ
ncbi:MAG TPA: phosphoribosylglycinamide formyltransferase [Ilumatobacter sp.]|nr:phosphoribosylglycinamide formyltransferase [Ilumatobacter sp.]